MAKKNVKQTRGNVYELTEKGKKLDPKELGAQKAAIFPLVKTGKMTAREIAEKLGKKTLNTTQEAIAVVSFYLGNWKKDGIVRYAKRPAKAAKPKAAKPKAAPQAETAVA